MHKVLTPDDMLKGDLCEVGWHPCEISLYEEKEAGTDKSTNCIFTFKIIDGKDKGKTGNKLFNEKSLGFGKALWAIIVPGFDKVKGGNLDSATFTQSQGKTLKVYMKRGKSDRGNEFNDPTDFMMLNQ